MTLQMHKYKCKNQEKKKVLWHLQKIIMLVTDSKEIQMNEMPTEDFKNDFFKSSKRSKRI